MNFYVLKTHEPNSAIHKSFNCQCNPIITIFSVYFSINISIKDIRMKGNCGQLFIVTQKAICEFNRKLRAAPKHSHFSSYLHNWWKPH